MIYTDQKRFVLASLAVSFSLGQTANATYFDDAEIEAATGGTVISREITVEQPVTVSGFSYLGSSFPSYSGVEVQSLAPISTNSDYRDRFFGFGQYRYVRASFGTLNRSYKDENLAGQTVTFDGEQTYIGARAGMMFDKHWGIEARLAHNDKMEYANVGSENAKYGFRGLAAVFGRVQTDLGNGFTPYLNLGPVAYHTKFEAWNAGANSIKRKTSYSLGGAAGLEFALPTNFVIGLDAFYLTKDIQGFSLSVGYNF